ncbi:hypothetical protein [Bacillus cereus]|nr:hypothetical protein [Bacillus cereus]
MKVVIKNLPQFEVLEFCMDNIAEDLEGNLKVDLFIPIKNIPNNK